ncbi:MAG: hypothetical protein ACREBI_11015 [Nitrosotalea sp.]
MTIDITRPNKKHLAASVLALAMVGYLTVPAFAMQTDDTNYQMPVTAQVTATASDCTNHPGPYITLSGSIGMSPVSAQFTFQNNADGTHTYSSTSTANAVVQGTTIEIPKQPVQGGVGGNPYIFIQFVDSNGNPLTAPVFLGRCVQGFTTGTAAFSIPTTLTADVSALECDNTASDIDFSGTLVLDSAVKAQIIFTNNADGTHTNKQVINTTLLPSGVSIEFPKQPSLGGVGGNPWIYLQFQDGNGTPIGSSDLLGRCVQNF